MSESPPDPGALSIEEIELLREELARRTRELGSGRWNADPEDVRRSVVKLVLTLVEFVRQLLERQVLRRLETESLLPEEVERLGLALMRLEETVNEIAERFEIPPGELNVELGPLGRLL